MISTNNYICFVIIKTQKQGDCNLGPTDTTYNTQRNVKKIVSVSTATIIAFSKNNLGVRHSSQNSLYCILYAYYDLFRCPK